jgi:hypothetical protein
MVIKMGKAGLNGSNDESDIKSCLAANAESCTFSSHSRYSQGKTLRSAHPLIPTHAIATPVQGNNSWSVNQQLDPILLNGNLR